MEGHSQVRPDYSTKTQPPVPHAPPLINNPHITTLIPHDHGKLMWHAESQRLTPPQHNPQRLSALYQYHNAPELAPVSGLEYDDTIHDGASDKYPVVHHRHYESTIVGGKVYDNDRPPRIIFGMKVRTFLLVAAIMLLLIVGAAVGGALGGARRENHVQPDYSPANIETNSGSSSASTYAWNSP